jgi:hypothetical protein
MWWFIGAAGVLLAMAAALPCPDPEGPAEPARR